MDWAETTILFGIYSSGFSDLVADIVMLWSSQWKQLEASCMDTRTIQYSTSADQVVEGAVQQQY